LAHRRCCCSATIKMRTRVASARNAPEARARCLTLMFPCVICGPDAERRPTAPHFRHGCSPAWVGRAVKPRSRAAVRRQAQGLTARTRPKPSLNGVGQQGGTSFIRPPGRSLQIRMRARRRSSCALVRPATASDGAAAFATAGRNRPPDIVLAVVPAARGLSARVPRQGAVGAVVGM
jgi:hypothetical protein